MKSSLPWRCPGFPRPGDLMRIGRVLVQEPSYAALWKSSRDWKVMDQAGFMVDALDRARADLLGSSSPHMRMLTTPLPVGLPQCHDDVVLLATGAFAPLHEGHIAMFDLAEKALQSKGIRVLASYLSPSHDAYVSTKPLADQYPASRRIHEARQIFEGPGSNGVDRLVDPWESTIAPVALNFTTIIRRLQAYLFHHLGRPVRVVYLFGADNVGFSQALEAVDHVPAGICVARPGHVCSPSPSTWALQASSPRASSHIRKGISQPMAVSSVQGDAGCVYLVRDEGSFAFQHWVNRVPCEHLHRAWSRFVKDVMASLASAFVSGAPCPGEFRRVELDEQRATARLLLGQYCVANMDPCTQGLPGMLPVSIARYFRPAHGQALPLERAPRPGAHGLMDPHDLARLKSSDLPVALVDDDCATGQSMDHVCAWFTSAGVRDIKKIALAPHDAFDIVDARDFLPGAFAAGLAVRMPTGEGLRLPYMAPFVDLSTRAKLPPASLLPVSIALWQAASRFFKALPVQLVVEDMHPSQASAFIYQGFAPTFPLEQLCLEMARLLGYNLSGSDQV